MPYGNVGDALAPTSSVANVVAPDFSEPPPPRLVLPLLPPCPPPPLPPFPAPTPRPITIFLDPPRLPELPRSSSLVKCMDVSFSGRLGPPNFVNYHSTKVGMGMGVLLPVVGFVSLGDMLFDGIVMGNKRQTRLAVLPPTAV